LAQDPLWNALLCHFHAAGCIAEGPLANLKVSTLPVPRPRPTSGAAEQRLRRTALAAIFGDRRRGGYEQQTTWGDQPRAAQDAGAQHRGTSRRRAGGVGDMHNGHETPYYSSRDAFAHDVSRDYGAATQSQQYSQQYSQSQQYGPSQSSAGHSQHSHSQAASHSASQHSQYAFGASQEFADLPLY